MNKMISIASSFRQSTTGLLKSQITKDFAALWAVAAFILGTIYIGQVMTVLVLIAREVQ